MKPGIRSFLEQAERDRRLRGLAILEITAALKFGAICSVKDEGIHFPKERLPLAGPRAFHDGRRAIVAQPDHVCRDDQMVALIVVPCTASYEGQVSMYDYEIPADERGFTKHPVIALVSLAQPILKSDIKEVHGVLRPSTLGALMSIFSRNLGLPSGVGRVSGE